jgi:autotransporter-associated beta strand protein
MKNRRFGLMIVVLAGALAAQAGQYWWSGDGTTPGGNGTWDASTARWGASDAGPFTTVWPNGGGDEAVFTNAGGTVTLGATAIKVNKMNFIGSAQYWTFNSGTLDFGSNGSVASANDDHVTINSGITGSGTLTLSTRNSTWGRGFSLYGNNSAFTGKLVVQRTAGSYLWFYPNNDVNFGAVPASYTADALTLDGIFLITPTATTLTIAANRGIRIGSGSLTVLNSSAATLNLNSVITGTGELMMDASSGSVNLNAANTYSGLTRLWGGKIVIGTDNAIPHGAGKSSLLGWSWNSPTTLDLNGHTLTINDLLSSTATYDWTSCLDNSAVGPATLVVGDNNANGGNFWGVLKNSGGALSLTKIGTGAQTFSGTNNSYTGATTVNQGTLGVDLVNRTSNVLPATSSLVLGGGTLNIKGNSSGTSSQTLANLTVNPAGSTISLTPNGGSGTTLTLGNTWTRQLGGTLLVDLSAAGVSTVTSSPALINGIIGGYAFVKDASGTGFATVSGGNVVRYTGATLLDAAAAAADLNSMLNYEVTSSVTLSGSSATQTVNSLSIVGVSGENKITPNGKVLVVGAGGVNYSVAGWARLTNGGYITSGTGDLVFNMAAGEADVGPIIDNGGTKVGLTKAGPGVLYINAGNTYSGNTVLNQGALIRANCIPIGVGKGDLLINAGAYVEMAGGSCVINGLSQSTNNPGGMVYNGWGSLQTVTLGNGDASASYSGVISGGGSGIALVKVGTGTQTLSGANTYAGGTTLSNGVLSVSSLSNIGGASANVTFAGGTLQINGTAFTSFGATPLTFTSAGGGLDIVDAGNTLTLTNNLSSGTVLTKTGAGTLSLTGTQAGTVTTDDPTKISFGSGLGFYNLGVTTNGVLSPAGSGMIGTFAVTNNLTLAGKLLVDVTASTNDMVTAGGSIALSAGATLEVVNTSLLNRSKQYTLMTSVGSVSGTFASSNLPARWKVGAFGNAVVLYYVNPGTMVRIF